MLSLHNGGRDKLPDRPKDGCTTFRFSTSRSVSVRREETAEVTESTLGNEDECQV